MKAALALVFFACVTSSMATDARSQFVDELLQQGQVVAQTVLALLQQQILGFVQQTVGQLSALVGSLGGRLDILDMIVDRVKPIVAGLINQALVQVLASLQGLIGGRAGIDLAALFSGFLQQITTPLAEIGQHVLNQGLAAALGGLGSLGRSRFLGDIFASLQTQISGAVAAAQGALSGALNNISALGASLMDASKPHWEQLQEQLVGHGLNVLGSLSETINNVHGTITNGGK